MKVVLAVLADEANVSQEGKLNLLGIFDRIDAATLPVIHPRMVFAFRVQTDYADGGRPFPVQVRLDDGEGNTLFEAVGEMVAPPVPPGEVLTANQVFSLVGVELGREGTYRFSVAIGGAEQASAEFRVQATGGDPALN